MTLLRTCVATCMVTLACSTLSIDWATSPAMQNQFAKYKINFVPAHPDVAMEPSLAAVVKGANIFPIDAAYAGANRKRIVERWVAEVLNE